MECAFTETCFWTENLVFVKSNFMSNKTFLTFLIEIHLASAFKFEQKSSTKNIFRLEIK